MACSDSSQDPYREAERAVADNAAPSSSSRYPEPGLSETEGASGTQDKQKSTAMADDAAASDDDNRAEEREDSERSVAAGDDDDPSEDSDERDDAAASDDDNRAEEREDSERSGAAFASYPHAGVYKYSQRGYEKFCQRSACDTYDLPAVQKVAIRYTDRSDDYLVLVKEARLSRRYFMRATHRFTLSEVVIREVHGRVNYRGVEYRDSYRPKPPIVSIDLPLAPGKRWTGTWGGDVNGRYEVVVERQGSIVIAGRRVRAARVRSSTSFRGEGKTGETKYVAWVDRRNGTVLTTDGILRVESPLGRVEVDLTIKLRSGPGYGGKGK